MLAQFFGGLQVGWAHVSVIATTFPFDDIATKIPSPSELCLDWFSPPNLALLMMWSR
jgi:hypothetical protein